MTSTFQTNLSDTTYNGWTNYETWNVSLWIGNDEGLYNLAREHSSYQQFCEMIEEFMTETPDGVKWSDPAINTVEMDEMFEEL
tara:strand:- start:120 stop:368 length:249 start_codon:yes stop_codon:yes gene_type:complete